MVFLELYEYICSYDKYGYKFNFDFKCKGTYQYSTFIGGCASIAFYICLLVVLVL